MSDTRNVLSNGGAGAPVIISPLAAADLHELFQFYGENMPAARRISELYRWRLEHPESGGVRTMVARCAGAIVGSVNVIPVRLDMGGVRILASWQQDTVVAASVRGRGIGRQLVQYAARDYEIVLGKGTLEPMYRLKQAIGYRDIPGDNYLVRLLTPWPRRGSVLRRLAAPLLFTVQAARQLLQRRPHDRVRITEIDRFDAEFDALADRRAAAAEVTPFKDSNYLNWRYFTCPGRKYHVLRAESTDTLRGAAVLRLGDEPHEDSWLVDLLLDPAEGNACDALLEGAIEVAKRSGASALRAFCSSSTARPLLYRWGFLNSSDSPRFTCLINSDRAGVIESATWNFWHGDGDTELLD